jgi:hypothetical protein
LVDRGWLETGAVTLSGSSSVFAGFRFPPEVISVAVRWYLRYGRYGLSYRMPGNCWLSVARGRDFEFVAYRQNWGEDRVHLHDENGVLFSLPAGWTDVVPADPFVVVADGRCTFTAGGLLALAELIDGLRSLSAVRAENLVVKAGDPVKALGMDSGISTSEVSRICIGFDTEVAAFRDRSPAGQPFRYAAVPVYESRRAYWKARVDH